MDFSDFFRLARRRGRKRIKIFDDFCCSGRENKDVNNAAIDLWQPLAILTMSFGFRHKTVRVIHPRATLLIEGGFILCLFIFLGISNPYPKALLYLSSQNSHCLPFSIREIYYFLKKKCKLFCRYS